MIRKLTGDLSLSSGSLTDWARSGDRAWLLEGVSADRCAQVQADPNTPVVLNDDHAPFYWAHHGEFYVTNEQLLPDDVVALLAEAENRKRLKLQKAHALQAMVQELDGTGRRETIPRDVKLYVWQRDRGRCVSCQSNRNLEFDHIIPLSLGGSNTERNLQLLCADCNQRKGSTLGGEHAEHT